MSISKDIIEELKRELDSKINQRETILDQLQILDVSIDRYDSIIENIDREVLRLTKPINDVADEVKAAYDARINSGCRSNLTWVELGKTKAIINLEGNFAEIFLITYQVQENPATKSFKPYDGLKFYSKPSNRDYGSTLVAEFIGSATEDSSVIAITASDRVTSILSEIQIGDTITDDLISPEIFSLGELPEVTGTGTTDAIGIVTTLTGGIFTSGTTFFQFGAGSLTDVELGMLLIDTEATNPVLQKNTAIVGFGTTGNYPVEYFNEVGILTTSNILCNTITIDKPALRALEEGEFTVGIVSTFPAVFISTTSNQTAVGASFFVIRTGDRNNIDVDFNPTSNPNSPVNIGSIGIENLGVGSSAYYDFSGYPSQTQPWRSESAREEIIDFKGKVIAPAIIEPKVGVGQASYNIGTTQWPIKSTFTGLIGFGTYFTSYAPLGTKIRTIFGSSSIGYASQPPGGIPSNCGQLDSNISQAESKYNVILSKNRPPAQRVATQSIALRVERSRKELIAYSLLQASSSLRKDIEKLQQTLQELDGVDFSPYETS